MISSDKIVTLIYISLGIAAGYLSNLVNNIFVAVVISFAVFILTQYYFLKKFKPPKAKRFVAENFMTFVLVWLVIWIFLFNMR